MKIIWHWLILSALIYALTYLFPGQIVIDQSWGIIVVGAVLMFVRMIIDPIVNLLAIPFNLFTLGLFSVLFNAVVFWFLPFVISGFHVANFKVALIGSLVISIGDWLLGKIIR